MRIETNVKLAKRNRSIATYLFFGTMLVLIGSFFLINQSLITGSADTVLTVILQAFSLPLAFVLTIFSVRMTNLWARDPRPDVALTEGLKGLSKKSVLYNYYHFPARHILFAPQGIYVFVTRWHNGKFTVTDDKWQSHKNPLSRFLALARMDGIGNPFRDAQRDAQHVAELLKDIEPNARVTPIIVCLDPRIEVEVVSSSVPIVYADAKQKPNLINLMRQISRETEDGKKNEMPLTEAQIEQFEAKTIKQ